MDFSWFYTLIAIWEIQLLLQNITTCSNSKYMSATDIFTLPSIPETNGLQEITWLLFFNKLVISSKFQCIETHTFITKVIVFEQFSNLKQGQAFQLFRNLAYCCDSGRFGVSCLWR